MFDDDRKILMTSQTFLTDRIRIRAEYSANMQPSAGEFFKTNPATGLFIPLR